MNIKHSILRFFFHIAYNGAPYSGWQYQPKSFSVQQLLEEKLFKIFKRKITIYGCGRTDKGVHASQYFFHIDLIDGLPHDFEFIFNKHLPSSVILFEIIPVNEKEHCRYHAVARTYDYFIHTKSDPFLNQYSTLITGKELDFEKMKKAAAILKEYDDFRGFCLQPDSHNHTLCEIKESKLCRSFNGDLFRFSITANRFLKGMIRILVSNLIKVGERNLTLDQFESHLKNNSSVFNSHKPAPPNGLYLSRVEYRNLKRKNESVFFSKLVQGLEY